MSTTPRERAIINMGKLFAFKEINKESTLETKEYVEGLLDNVFNLFPSTNQIRPIPQDIENVMLGEYEVAMNHTN